MSTQPIEGAIPSPFIDIELPKVKVSQFVNDKGVPVRNQFIIEVDGCVIFQSYSSVIAMKETYSTDQGIERAVYLDETYWNYSKTTSRYRSQFLNESTKETEKKIAEGVYQLVNLN